ncbi:GNAT family protein [Aureisphaera galaxeae]|uniref:GNAT family N-acetyltransferase n=1 Tax=Aureisphaera galaxeae TaxID=1538023 RepID=UPI002350BE19|nr:GNAT family protein [Aureisphaera galaxeae]MDC8004804.1 GNAT family protein [Aureisphaera galaxeae]
MSINVREIAHKDIPSLVDYWMSSDPDFLVGMGVDLDKMPAKETLEKAFSEQIDTTYRDKQSYALIWELDGKAIGHTNINQIQFGKRAHMHLHLWYGGNRKKGMGSTLVMKSLPFFFKNYELDELYCEPYALNPAPNKTLAKIGFEFVKTYETIPGSINFFQEVNQWRLTREKFQELRLKNES